MDKKPLLLPSIALPPKPPPYLPAPKFEIGQRVYWKALSNPDFGHILGVVWATEASVQAIGYHYAVLLDPTSPSSAFTQLDWAFEDDLAAMPVHPPFVVYLELIHPLQVKVSYGNPPL